MQPARLGKPAVDSIGVFVTSGDNRAMFYYNLGDCTMPGKYELVLRIAGEELMRRPITILPRSGRALPGELTRRTAGLVGWPVRGIAAAPSHSVKNFAFFAAPPRCRLFCPRLDFPSEGLGQWEARPGRCFSSV